MTTMTTTTHALSPPASYVFNLSTPLTALSAAGVTMTDDERAVYAEWKMVWGDVCAEKLGNAIRGRCEVSILAFNSSFVQLLWLFLQYDDDESELTEHIFPISISADAFAISLVQEGITTSTSFKFSDALLNSLLINPDCASKPTAEDSTTSTIPTKRPRRVLPPQRPVPTYPPPPVPTTNSIDTVSIPIVHDAPITETDFHIPPVAALLRQHDYRSIQVRRVRKAKRVAECENVRPDIIETARGQVNEPAVEEIFDASVDAAKGQVNEPKVAKTSKTIRRLKSLHNLKRFLPI
jgi:hypothetical protein